MARRFAAPAVLGRRAALLAPFLLAACGDEEPPPPRSARREYPPLRYAYLPPIQLNVQRLEISKDFVPPSDGGEVSALSPAGVPETLFAMARDRLRPMGASGTATFSVRTASIVRTRNVLNGLLAVRLELRNGDGTATAFADARASSPAEGVPINGDLTAAIYDLLKTLMDQMNVELEYQIRGQLRSWLYEPPPPAPAQISPTEPLPLPPRPPAMN